MSVDRTLNVILQVQDMGTGETLLSVRRGLDDLAATSERTGRVVEGSTGKLVSGLGGFGRAAGIAFIAYDRLTIASLAVENAQTRQSLAQERLQHALERYPANSREVTMAQKELENSTRSLEIAEQRYWIRTIFGISILIPEAVRGYKELINIIRSFTAVTQAATVAQTALNASMITGGAAGTFGGAMAGAEIAALGGRVATGGALGAVGGPWGIALMAGLTAASIGISYLLSQQQQPAPAGAVNVYGDMNVHPSPFGPPAEGLDQAIRESVNQSRLRNWRG